MKFAAIFAIVLLSQCFGTDAWYINCRHFNSFKSETNSAITSLWHRVNPLGTYRDQQGRTLNGIASSVSARESSLKTSKSILSQGWSLYWSGYHMCHDVNRMRPGLEKRIAKIETMNAAVYRNTDLLTYLIENISE